MSAPFPLFTCDKYQALLMTAAISEDKHITSFQKQWPRGPRTQPVCAWLGPWKRFMVFTLMTEMALSNFSLTCQRDYCLLLLPSERASWVEAYLPFHRSGSQGFPFLEYRVCPMNRLSKGAWLMCFPAYIPYFHTELLA